MELERNEGLPKKPGGETGEGSPGISGEEHGGEPGVDYGEGGSPSRETEPVPEETPEAGGPLSELDEEPDESGPAPEGIPRKSPEGGRGAGEVPEALHPKAGILNRVIARFIDILAALLIAMLPGYIGLLSGIVYLSIADGLMGGRSIGKRIIGLKVIYAEGGRPADFRASIIRNVPMSVLFVISRIPFVGWFIACLGLAFETVLIIGSPEGKRLGDELAGTVVAEESRPARS